LCGPGSHDSLELRGRLSSLHRHRRPPNVRRRSVAGGRGALAPQPGDDGNPLPSRSVGDVLCYGVNRARNLRRKVNRKRSAFGRPWSGQTYSRVHVSSYHTCTSHRRRPPFPSRLHHRRRVLATCLSASRSRWHTHACPAARPISGRRSTATLDDRHGACREPPAGSGLSIPGYPHRPDPSRLALF
jgi:hypothetical protein